MHKYKVQSRDFMVLIVCITQLHILRSIIAHSCFTGYDRQTHGCEILQLFQDVFSLLPIATIIDGKILIVHGGISDQTDLDLLNTIERHKVGGNKQPTVPSPLL